MSVLSSLKLGVNILVIPFPAHETTVKITENICDYAIVILMRMIIDNS